MLLLPSISEMLTVAAVVTATVTAGVVFILSSIFPLHTVLSKPSVMRLFGLRGRVLLTSVSIVSLSIAVTGKICASDGDFELDTEPIVAGVVELEVVESAAASPNRIGDG